MLRNRGEPNPNTDPNLNANADHNLLYPNTDPNLDSEADPNADPNLDPEADPNTNPNINSKDAPNLLVSWSLNYSWWLQKLFYPSWTYSCTRKGPSLARKMMDIEKHGNPNPNADPNLDPEADPKTNPNLNANDVPNFLVPWSLNSH